MRRNLELLVPAGSLELLKTAIDYGADAVYIGGEAFGLRAKAKNFTIEDMAEGIRYAHERNKKVYVTANVLAHNDQIEDAKGYFEQLREINPDALIISDPGIFTIAREVLEKSNIEKTDETCKLINRNPTRRMHVGKGYLSTTYLV